MSTKLVSFHRNPTRFSKLLLVNVRIRKKQSLLRPSVLCTFHCYLELLLYLKSTHIYLRALTFLASFLITLNLFLLNLHILRDMPVRTAMVRIAHAEDSFIKIR